MQTLLTQWFRVESGEPYLMGSRCDSCGAYYFPPQLLGCRNSSCDASKLRLVPLSNSGVLWSYTTLYERPPPPFIDVENFSPLPIVVVELPVERIKVMGYLANQTDSSSLTIGRRLRLVMAVGNEGSAVDYRSLQWRVMEEVDGQ